MKSKLKFDLTYPDIDLIVWVSNKHFRLEFFLEV